MKRLSGTETFVGIYAKNCPEWMIGALGCIQQSIVVVPLYDTLGAEAASYIVQQTNIEVVFNDNAFVPPISQNCISFVHLRC